MITVTKNIEFNGLEIKFDFKPDLQTLQDLKNHGFRWHNLKKVWYAKENPERQNFVNLLSGEKLPEVKKEKFELTKENLLNCINFESWKGGKVSDHAAVSRACKKFLKLAGIDCEIYSQSYSMGDSVNITTTDLDYKTEQKINSLFSMFEYGHFDGMNDIYEFDNCNDRIPQTKYLIYQNRWSDEKREELTQKTREILSDFDSFTWSEQQHWLRKTFEDGWK